MLEIAEIIAEAANEGLKENLRQMVERGEAVTDPGLLTRLREGVEKMEQLEARQMARRIQGEYQRLGIASPDSLEAVTAKDVERTPAYQQLVRQLRECGRQERLPAGLSMEEFVQRAIRGEV